MTANQKNKMHAILECMVEYLKEAEIVGNNIQFALDTAIKYEKDNADFLRFEIQEEMGDPMGEVKDDISTAKRLAEDLKTMIERWF